LKYENHIKELNLFKRIKCFLNITINILETKPCKDRPNSNITVTLDIQNISFLKYNIILLFSKPQPSFDIGICNPLVNNPILRAKPDNNVKLGINNNDNPTLINSTILKTDKLKDFKDWCLIVDIYYYGYHLLPEGLLLIKDIKKV
jgi:hypothetical protein